MHAVTRLQSNIRREEFWRENEIGDCSLKTNNVQRNLEISYHLMPLDTLILIMPRS